MKVSCARAELAAVIVLFVAVVFNIVAFSAPLWTTSTTVNESLKDTVKSSDFAAGIWGFCSDVEFNTSDSFDHCFLFHTSSKYDVPDMNSDLMANFSDYSVCDAYKRAGYESLDMQFAYASALGVTAGLDGKQFDNFLDRSCGSLGSAALAFGGISMSLGVLSFVALVLGFTCFKKHYFYCVVAGMVLMSMARDATIVLFILWLVQAHPLGKADDVALNASFILTVICIPLYMAMKELLDYRKLIASKKSDDQPQPNETTAP
ncbi:unnamed protein product [Phytophthora lilii]|uniref:Unnamed protein product n=1 Tax=Phytophthora lilii TaxID=2077276 RepID=A0A9W6TSW2_9STRA|nr:unnamed protein product [Phytophthora lilii]